MTDQKEYTLTFSQRILRPFMRLFFFLLYHPFAGLYDLVSAVVSVGRWNDWVDQAAKLVDGERVLELGFGPGHLQGTLHRAGRMPVGLDESWQMARQAARRLKRSGHTPHLLRGVAQRLPFPNRAFDSVVATFPTLYITDPDSLSEIRRVLKPNGRLVVLSVGWITGRKLSDRLMARLFQVTGQVPDEHIELASFLEPFTEAGFRAKLRFVNVPNARLLFIIANPRET